MPREYVELALSVLGSRSTLSNILGCDLLGDASIKARLAQRPALALSRRAGFFDPSIWPRQARQQEMILGIDVGARGAIAVLDQSGASVEVHDMPTYRGALVLSVAVIGIAPNPLEHLRADRQKFAAIIATAQPKRYARSQAKM